MAVNPELCADALLAELGINNHRDIDPRLFAECLDIKVCTKPLQGLDGCLLRLGNFGTIICNSEINNSARRRFTIAHELGHWLMHADQSQHFLVTEESVARHKASPMEAEANLFAGCLLMPRKWFVKHINGVHPVIESMVTLANEFDVSIMATTKRYLDLTQSSSMAVFSDGYTVKWVWKAPSVSNIFLRPGTEISDDCTAYECQDSPDVAARVGAIWNSGESWFPEDSRGERILVKEQSCRLHGETVLTLMTVDLLEGSEDIQSEIEARSVYA